MREADNKSIFLSVVGVYVVRTSSLNDMHSCQLFRKAASFSSLVLLSSSVSRILHLKMPCLMLPFKQYLINNSTKNLAGSNSRV